MSWVQFKPIVCVSVKACWYAKTSWNKRWQKTISSLSSTSSYFTLLPWHLKDLFCPWHFSSFAVRWWNKLDYGVSTHNCIIKFWSGNLLKVISIFEFLWVNVSNLQKFFDKSDLKFKQKQQLKCEKCIYMKLHQFPALHGFHFLSYGCISGGIDVSWVGNRPT